jgi:hypothetical protein
MPAIIFPLGRMNLNAPAFGVPPSMSGVFTFAATYLRIFGVTKDGSGAALGSCVVVLYRSVNDVVMDRTVSDASGNYEFRSASLSTAYYVVAYLAGSPDRVGTTVNSLIGS